LRDGSGVDDRQTAEPVAMQGEGAHRVFRTESQIHPASSLGRQAARRKLVVGMGTIGGTYRALAAAPLDPTVPPPLGPHWTASPRSAGLAMAGSAACSPAPSPTSAFRGSGEADPLIGFGATPEGRHYTAGRAGASRSVAGHHLVGQWYPSRVTMRAITTCTQSERLSRL
jgi:hypothetical protein